MKTPRPRHFTGFTLTELLVVITIILILASLSFLGLARMRTAAETALTVSNMRQLQTASISYSTEHNGRYVNYLYTDAKGLKTYWYRDLEFLSYLTGNQELVGKTAGDINEDTVVPENMLDPTAVRAKQRWSTRLPGSFGMNYEFIKTATNPDGSQERYMRASGITNASRTAAFITATDSAARYSSRNLWWSSPVEGKSTDGKLAFRHGEKAAVVYFDGSTGLISKQDIDRIDAEGGKANPFWKGDY